MVQSLPVAKMVALCDQDKQDLPPSTTGHISVVIDRKMYVWGGFGSQITRQDHRQEVFSYDLDSGLWKRLALPDITTVPNTRSGAVGLAFGQEIFVFAGWRNDIDHSNDMIAFNSRTHQWREVVTKYVPHANAVNDMRPPHARPSRRDKLAGVVYDGKLYFFGGWGFCEGMHRNNATEGPDGGLGWNNELWCFDPLESTWSFVPYTGNAPAPRAAHTMAIVDQCAYVFGGRDREGRKNDIFRLNMETFHWEGPLDVVGAVPLGRSWHIAVPLSCQRLLIHGGLSSVDDGEEALSDSWVFDTKHNVYTEVRSYNEPRLWHTAVVDQLDQHILVFGGRTSGRSMHNRYLRSELLRAQFGIRSLKRTCARVIASELSSESSFITEDEAQSVLPDEVSQEVQRLNCALLMEAKRRQTLWATMNDGALLPSDGRSVAEQEEDSDDTDEDEQ